LESIRILQHHSYLLLHIELLTPERILSRLLVYGKTSVKIKTKKVYHYCGYKISG